MKKMRICFAALLVATNLFAVHGGPARAVCTTAKQRENIVNRLIITPDKDQKEMTGYYDKVMEVVAAGIESIADDLIITVTTTTTTTQKPETTSTTTTTTTTTPKPDTTSTTTTTPPKPEPKPEPDEKDEDKGGERRRKRDAEEKTTTAEPVTKAPRPKLTTVFVFDEDLKDPKDFDFDKPIEFYVTTEYHEIINGEKLADDANDIVKKVEEARDKGRLKEDVKLKFEISVVKTGMATWGIVLIVIAVLLVVGAAGYFTIAYFRKQRGNSF